MVRVKIVIRSTHFIVNILDNTLNHIIKTFSSKYNTYTFIYDRHKRRKVKIADKEYYSHIPHTNTYRFSIGSLKDFVSILREYNIGRDDISLRYEKCSIYNSLDVIFNITIVPRDYQYAYSDILVSPNSNTILLVDLATGHGKTLISMHAVSRLNIRTAILVLPKYIEKWIDDVKKYTDVTDDDIFVVQGYDSLVELMENNNVNYKFIIFSMRTVSNYITSYEDNSMLHVVPPDMLMEHLKIGVLLNDESHQHFHAIFKTLLYFNVSKVICLSATMTTNNLDIKKMYDNVFPVENRISNLVEYSKYIKVKAIEYRLESTKGILYQRQQGYNHIMFEQSILRNNVLLRYYLELILWYIKESYITKRVDGDKLLIFASTVNMCTIITNHVKSIYTELDIRRYVEDDPYINIIEADISVSTVIGAGTAIDIPNLIAVIQTISISSVQANLQSMGRLRKLDNKEVWYYYIYTRDINNQYRMHLTRLNTIKNRVKTYLQEEYFKLVKTK